MVAPGCSIDKLGYLEPSLNALTSLSTNSFFIGGFVSVTRAVVSQALFDGQVLSQTKKGFLSSISYEIKEL